MARAALRRTSTGFLSFSSISARSYIAGAALGPRLTKAAVTSSFVCGSDDFSALRSTGKVRRRRLAANVRQHDGRRQTDFRILVFQQRFQILRGIGLLRTREMSQRFERRFLDDLVRFGFEQFNQWASGAYPCFTHRTERGGGVAAHQGILVAQAGADGAATDSLAWLPICPSAQAAFWRTDGRESARAFLSMSVAPARADQKPPARKRRAAHPFVLIVLEDLHEPAAALLPRFRIAALESAGDRADGGGRHVAHLVVVIAQIALPGRAPRRARPCPCGPERRPALAGRRHPDCSTRFASRPAICPESRASCLRGCQIQGKEASGDKEKSVHGAIPGCVKRGKIEGR